MNAWSFKLFFVVSPVCASGIYACVLGLFMDNGSVYDQIRCECVCVLWLQLLLLPFRVKLF